MLIRRRFPEQQNRDDGCCEGCPSDAVLVHFERSPPECSRMAAVTRKVGQQRSDGGVEEEALAVFAL